MLTSLAQITRAQAQHLYGVASGQGAQAAAMGSAHPAQAASHYGASARVLASPEGAVSGAESARRRKEREAEEPIYGSNYRSYDGVQTAFEKTAPCSTLGSLLVPPVYPP